MPESKIIECIKSVYPNAIVNIVKDKYGLKIEVFDNFIESSEDRLRKIFNSFISLEVGIKAKIGLVETYSIAEYAVQQQNEMHHHQENTQEPCEEIRWVSTPDIIGFIACGVNDESRLMRCDSSFILASLDKKTGDVYNYGENYTCENDAYSFIIRNGDSMYNYALNHVYNLSPSFFISPYMDKYMRGMQENGFGAQNPYHFAFQPLPFTFAKPGDDIILKLNSPELKQRIASTSVPSLRDRLNQYFR